MARARQIPRWLSVRAAWRAGQRRPALPAEPPDAGLIAEADALRAAAIADARDRHAGTGLRAFLVRPPTISGLIWFDTLGTALRHMGVPTAVVSEDAPDWESQWRAVCPTLLVAPDRASVHARLDAGARDDLATRRGLRLLVHMAPAGFPHAARMDADDEARTRLALAGRTADAFLSLYEPEYFQRYAAPLSAAGFRYLALPQACDPFSDGPRPVARAHAWFMASTLTADRLAVAYDVLRPVLSASPGLWVGSGWRFGSPRVAPADLPALFSASRIALAPLVPFLRDQPLEITYRVFAAAACGAFQVTHRTPVTARFFADDELVQADDDAGFARACAWYLPRPDERQAVARRALRRAWRDHTTFSRADRLVAFARSLHSQAGSA
ncbi:glycosyltransferase [Luteitalea sp. TBR-22]|uniref:glycosyltransferase family protein n=1 Tax=Luteitalea sp. TBR-22 TaxID=2802971 RepID=UPI001EF54C82|nr:glycosyltransferase [Luteitalea sp. TBR-22]